MSPSLQNKDAHHFPAAPRMTRIMKGVKQKWRSDLQIASVQNADVLIPLAPNTLPPAPRLRRGTTLIELLIAMLILAIVCIAWLEIIGIQSARREARRREAVERLAGMMDAFMYWCKCNYDSDGYDSQYEYITMGNYKLDEANFMLYQIDFKKSSDSRMSADFVHKIYSSEVSPIGYQLRVVQKSDLHNQFLFGNKWGAKLWLIGELYDQAGTAIEAGKPYFYLQSCLGINEE